MASSNQHHADIHDLIRVQDARVNNLKDVSVEIPKRRLTVFNPLAYVLETRVSALQALEALAGRSSNHFSAGFARTPGAGVAGLGGS